MHLSYELTPSAEADLTEIARYTSREWGPQQAVRYSQILEGAFQKIAGTHARSRVFSEKYPQIRVTRCERHYVFYLHPEDSAPRIFAVLHERMDILARLETRLSPPS